MNDSRAHRIRLFGNILLGLFLPLTLVSVALADITPAEVLVLANKNLPASLEVARYYMSQRSIPRDQLILLDLPSSTNMSRKEYDTHLVQPLRAFLEKKQLAQKIRVLVTTYGIPLHTLAPEPSEEEAKGREEAVAIRHQALLSLSAIQQDAEALAKDKKVNEHEIPDDLDTQSPIVLLESAQRAIQKAAEYVQKNQEATGSKERRQRLNQIVTNFGGLNALSQTVKIDPADKNPQAEAALSRIQSDVEGGKRFLQALDETHSVLNRRRAYGLTARIFGAVGMLNRAESLAKIFELKEADVSTDSELALLWWDKDEYVLSERLPNPFYHKFPTDQFRQFQLPILLVSRLDGPSVGSIKQSIDQAIRAEGKGISGKVYVDARGIEKEDKSYGYYDQNLRDFAWLVREKTSLSAELDNHDARFSDKDAAPDVALYAGWYKLRSYEDAFTFMPGAIGYHLASEEAVELHDPDEQGWCKNALEHGITATLGAVGEPYLDSFPLPLEFFGLLLTGEYTLVEAYALTSLYISWRMVLIGDPLYNPWKGKSELTGSALAKKSDHAATLDPLPKGPGDFPFPDPLAGRKALTERQKKLRDEIDAFFKKVEEKSQQIQTH